MENFDGFAKFRLSTEMLSALKNKGFEIPTPIQEKTIPLILDENRDFVGMAQTGTGKTAAFGIPIIDKISERSNFPQVLVLAPTRELAIQ
ncbi:MAG: DEAD/DEAH box helicase, partial [Calditrichaeota bacterium]|nr:DEAD/DEAH box helicase [Calditrichota bacterium]